MNPRPDPGPRYLPPHRWWGLGLSLLTMASSGWLPAAGSASSSDTVNDPASTATVRSSAQQRPDQRPEQRRGQRPDPDRPLPPAAQKARDAVQRAGAASARILAEPPAQKADGSLDAAATRQGDARLAEVATGIYLESLQAQLVELGDQGWRQEGAPTVVRTELLEDDPDASPPSMVLQVCLDASDVRILDDTGHDLRGDGTPDRSWHIYHLEQHDGRWLLARESFPADADCSTVKADPTTKAKTPTKDGR